jgi:hypothetical protein
VQYSGLIITHFFILFITTASLAKASNNYFCDYYDLYGEFIITFPKDIDLGKSGPSTTSGISFIFPDQSTLKIFPSADTYNPPEIDTESQCSRNDMKFIMEYAQDGCYITKTTDTKRVTISCKDHEYTIIEANNQPSHKVYISIYYDFKSKQYDSLYHNIIGLFALVQEDKNDKFSFYNAARQANAEYYYAQDAVYQKLVDEYQVPNIVCGSYRIRDRLLQKPLSSLRLNDHSVPTVLYRACTIHFDKL